MKISKIFLSAALLLLLSGAAISQDIRLLETKVADLLAQFPAKDTQYTDKLMADMLALGDDGLRNICERIIPAGTGDDTQARFAVESLSRYLSQPGKEADKPGWEKICLNYATSNKDPGVQDFFMKQLQLIGSELSVSALKGYLTNKELCSPALAAITSIGGKTAEAVLAESLKNRDNPCTAEVMNSLAEMKSQSAVSEYIYWASAADPDIKASAFNALAKSGSPLAYAVLAKAAKSVNYQWERSGATSAFLDYARNVGVSGDLKTMDKICRLVISKCNDKLSIQNKIKAREIYTGFHGTDAMKVLVRAVAYPDKSYRMAALRASVKIPGDEMISKWIEYYPKAGQAVKPEIINILGEKKASSALQLITRVLSDPDPSVRKEAALAIVRIEGLKAVPELIDYISKFQDQSDQEAGKTALMSVCGNNEISLLKPVLLNGPAPAKKTAIELIAWNSDPSNFGDVLKYTSSGDENVKSAAFAALPSLASPGDISALLALIRNTVDTDNIRNIQDAIANAANKIDDPEKKSETILKALSDPAGKEKILPVLARTGGREALALVLKEFENGNASMRDICFKALSTWHDYKASSALYEICASGDKTFEEPAFRGYVRQVRTADLPDEEKLLLFRKIMPFALSSDRKNEVLTEVGKLKTYQALFYISGYLDDPATSATAAKAAMTSALPSAGSENGMYGTIVRDILTKAIPKIAGSESEYDREMVKKYLESMSEDEGFVSMFNGKDLTGWQGLVENPIARSKMKRTELERKQAEANVMVPANWSVKDGYILFNGKGNNLCSIKDYGDFELLVDWRISKEGDSGIYLRGSPQVQIWDTSRTQVGAQVGSGGLYNNQINPSKPLLVADNPVGDWNSFRIIMIGEKVTVWLNGQLVVDNVTMENYWDRKIPIFPRGPIELQAHGTDLAFRDIYVREISDNDYNLTTEEKSEGYISLFNGRNLDNWVGNKQSYVVEDGMIVIKPDDGSGGNLYTRDEYSDFIFRFEFQLTPGANNGLGIRAPLEGDAAYVGMELQILDDTAPVYANLQPYQYHGSVYGVIPARRGFLKPVGEWNYEEVYVKGTGIRITLNGTVIVDGDISDARNHGTMDHNNHPGLKNLTGHIGFLGHGSVVRFRNIRIKDLSQ
jgi:HEAT repeat protein